MRVFNYKSEYQKLLTPEIVTYLAQIHEQKGQQNLFIEAQKDVLTELLKIAKIQSTEASNKIEGIVHDKLGASLRRTMEEYPRKKQRWPRKRENRHI